MMLEPHDGHHVREGSCHIFHPVGLVLPPRIMVPFELHLIFFFCNSSNDLVMFSYIMCLVLLDTNGRVFRRNCVLFLCRHLSVTSVWEKRKIHPPKAHQATVRFSFSSSPPYSTPHPQSSKWTSLFLSLKPVLSGAQKYAWCQKAASLRFKICSR